MKVKAIISTVFIIVFLIFSIELKAQKPVNRFTEAFQSADSAFNDSIGLKILESIDLVIDNQKTQAEITIKVRDYLQMYWAGYINGAMYSLKKGSVDLDSLKKDLIANRKSIESHLHFIKNQKVMEY